MNVRSETANRVAIAVCALMCIWGAKNALAGFDVFFHYGEIRFTYIRFGDVLSNLGLLSGPPIDFALAVLNWIAAWRIVRVLQEVAADDSAPYALFAPPVVGTVGWLIAANMLPFLAMSIISWAGVIHDAGGPQYVELHSARGPHLFAFDTLLELLSLVVPIVIGLLVVREGKRMAATGQAAVTLTSA